MADDLFDFGFTAVDEDELEAVQKVTQKALFYLIVYPRGLLMVATVSLGSF